MRHYGTFKQMVDDVGVPALLPDHVGDTESAVELYKSFCTTRGSYAELEQEHGAVALDVEPLVRRSITPPATPLAKKMKMDEPGCDAIEGHTNEDMDKFFQMLAGGGSTPIQVSAKSGSRLVRFGEPPPAEQQPAEAPPPVPAWLEYCRKGGRLLDWEAACALTTASQEAYDMLSEGSSSSTSTAY